jgi:DNA-binding Lrp family transcriptional regulator
MSAALDDADRRLVKATAAGLPLVPRPYEAVGAAIGMESAEVRRRLQALMDRGVIRRIGAVPNHYALGYRANGMSVWDVPDEKIAEIGVRVGALDFVSHCYERPRRLPDWPFNLFAMVHGRSRAEVEEKVAAIAALIGGDCRAHRVLYSSRILKKSGFRLQE